MKWGLGPPAPACPGQSPGLPSTSEPILGGSDFLEPRGGGGAQEGVGGALLGEDRGDRGAAGGAELHDLQRAGVQGHVFGLYGQSETHVAFGVFVAAGDQSVIR